MLQDIVQVLTMVKSEVGTPLVAELAAAGFPYTRATTPIAAASKALESPSVLVCDPASLDEMAKSLGPRLETNVKEGRLRIVVIGESASPIVTARIAKDAELPVAIETMHAVLLINRRTAARVEVAIPSVLEIEGGEGASGIVKTLSEGGASLACSPLPAVGAKGVLDLGDGLKVRALVVNERRFEKCVGLKFDALSPDDARLVHALVARALASTQAAERVSRTLVFDPSALMRRLLEAHLSAAGFLVTTSDAAADFAQRLSKDKFDLVIFDHASLGSRTAEIVRRIGTTPFVLFSGGEIDALKQAAQAHGAKDWIKKGTFADLFLARLKSLTLETIANPKPVAQAPKPVPTPAPVLERVAAPAFVPTPAAAPEPEEQAPEAPKKKERYNTDKLLAIERERQRKTQIIALVIVVALISVAVYFLAIRAPAPEPAPAPAHAE